MKKIPDFPKYWKRQKRNARLTKRSRRLARGLDAVAQKSDRKQLTFTKRNPIRSQAGLITHEIEAPENLRLFSNMRQTLEFVRELRALGNLVVDKPGNRIRIKLQRLKQINYATISILKAVIFDFTTREIAIVGDLPIESTCNDYLTESGYLDGLIDMSGRAFPPSEQSAHIFFKRGLGRLSREQNLAISDLLANAMVFMNGDIRHECKLKTLLLEGCANSIEWGETKGQQWMLGMKKEEKNGNREILFTITDVGKGILETLRRKFKDRFLNLVKFRTEHEVLQLAFQRQWGSRSEEINRNNGLPTIRKACELGMIEDLRVLSNNVILRFGENEHAETFERGFPRYSGTIYQWRVSADCLKRMVEFTDYEYD